MTNEQIRFLDFLDGTNSPIEENYVPDLSEPVTIREESISGTVAGCTVTVEYFEESGEQRACAYIERSGYSASLEWAEGEGTLTGPGEDRPISERTVAACRRWVERQGEY